MQKKAIVLNAKDNVATALADMEAGEVVEMETDKGSLSVTLVNPIPFGHKFSLRQTKLLGFEELSILTTMQHFVDQLSQSVGLIGQELFIEFGVYIVHSVNIIQTPSPFCQGGTKKNISRGFLEAFETSLKLYAPPWSSISVILLTL